MLKTNLANALRQRQYELGEVSRKLIDALSDDQIIDSYITCSCCGEKQVDDPNQLLRIIEESENVEQFFATCDAAAESKVRLTKCIEDVLKDKEF